MKFFIIFSLAITLISCQSNNINSRKHKGKVSNNNVPAFRSEILFSSEAYGSVKPLIKLYPRYPSEAGQQGIGGIVKLSLKINKGNVVGIQVIESKPQGLFEAAALKAVKRWKYKAFKQGELKETLIFTILPKDAGKNRNYFSVSPNDPWIRYEALAKFTKASIELNGALVDIRSYLKTLFTYAQGISTAYTKKYPVCRIPLTSIASDINGLNSPSLENIKVIYQRETLPTLKNKAKCHVAANLLVAPSNVLAILDKNEIDSPVLRQQMINELSTSLNKLERARELVGI